MSAPLPHEPVSYQRECWDGWVGHEWPCDPGHSRLLVDGMLAGAWFDATRFRLANGTLVIVKPKVRP